MKIISLTAENVKRLKAVEITPDGNVVTITGRNAQGKTSVLDAIWLALGGGPAAKGTTRPIRDGEAKASVTLDLGDFIVTRSWAGTKSALTVKSREGATFSGPQGVLDALVGRLSFDPLEFTRLSAREQTAALLDLVELDVDLDALTAERQAAYDERTEVGRRGKALGDTPAIAPGVPDEEVSAGALVASIRAAEAQRSKQREEREALGLALAKVKELEADLANWRAAVESHQATVDAHGPLADVDALEAELASVEDTNRAVRANANARDIAARKDALRAEYERLTGRIEAIDQAKSNALATATFPVDGLGFDDTGVTFQGVPFSQASSAEQIRVSLAMAMSLNPRLRVIRILDGSLLDADNLALIEQMAAEQDYQVWIERVSDPSETAVVIEDGEVI